MSPFFCKIFRAQYFNTENRFPPKFSGNARGILFRNVSRVTNAGLSLQKFRASGRFETRKFLFVNFSPGVSSLRKVFNKKMKFAKYTFYAAGIYGIIALLPQYFLEAKNNRDFPLAITHPEYFYGFIGVALAFQIVFLIIARNPSRYRPLMIPSVLEKFSFAFALAVLFLQGRLALPILAFGFIDFVLGISFIAAYFKTAEKP